MLTTTNARYENKTRAYEKKIEKYRKAMEYNNNNSSSSSSDDDDVERRRNMNLQLRSHMVLCVFHHSAV
jgi:hypothetical protein